LPGFDASGVLPMVVVAEREGGLTAADRSWLAGLEEIGRRWAVAPASVVNSDDGEAATLTYPIATVSEADDWPDSIADTRAAFDSAPEGLIVHATGPAAGAYDGFSVFDGLDTTILLASLGVVVAMLLLTYRSPVLWLLPVISIGIAMVASQAAIYFLGRHAGLPVNGQSGGILPILVFGVGTDYALLLTARYREQLRVVPDRHVAMGVALRRSAPAVSASAATVVLGMLCLLLADTNSTRSLGAVCAIGVACAAVAMLTSLPALLVLLGRWSFWPYIPHAGALDRESRRSARSDRRWRAVAGLSMRAPRATWIGAAAALGVLALTSLTLDLEPSEAERFRDVPDSVAGQEMVADHFTPGAATPVEIVAPVADADEAYAAARTHPGVGTVGSPVTSADGSLALMTVVLGDLPDSGAARQTVLELREALADVGTGESLVGGWTAQQVDVRDAAGRDALVVVPALLAVVGLVLLALLRSLVAAGALVGIALLTYLAALGSQGLVMRALGFDAVEPSLPLLGLVFLVPLGVDYTIFLKSRVREEVADHGHVEGVVRGLVATGGVVTSAGLVLAATFGVLWTMPLTGMVVMVSLGILLDTFVVRSLFVPALALDLGERWWWPGPTVRATRPVSPRPSRVTSAGGHRHE
jgi:RND superfamily putative drug exporter